MGKNLGPRLVLIGVITLLGILLLYPPKDRLRAGLDIAGGTSLVYEIDTTGTSPTEAYGLAERVKELLQKRVDPSGIYALTWRVHGSNRIEVQMPLPPKEKLERRQAYAAALNALYEQDLLRRAVEDAVHLSAEQRTSVLPKLAEGKAEQARAFVNQLKVDGPRKAELLQGIEQAVQRRQKLLTAAAQRWDELQAAQAARDQAAASRPAEPNAATTSPDTVPATQAATPDQQLAAERLRDAQELHEDAINEVLQTNVNRRRFEDVLELEEKSQTRKKSLAELEVTHADLLPQIHDVMQAYSQWRAGKQYLDGPGDLKRLLRGAGDSGQRRAGR